MRSTNYNACNIALHEASCSSADIHYLNGLLLVNYRIIKFDLSNLEYVKLIVKLNLINNYQDECNIQNCYICSQI